MAARTLKSATSIQPDEIYDDITDRIVSFELMPGQIISENTLSEKYNTSRTTIRAVLQRLERDTLVQIIPQKGSFVTYLSHEYIKSVMYIRYHVELDVMRRLKAVYRDEHEKRLAAIISEYDDPKKYDHNGNFAMDSKFHSCIYELVDSRPVWALVEMLDFSCRRYRMLMFQRYKSYFDNFTQKHFELLDVLKKGTDKDLAAALHHHIFGQVFSLKESLGSEWSTYF